MQTINLHRVHKKVFSPTLGNSYPNLFDTSKIVQYILFNQSGQRRVIFEFAR